MDARVGSLLMMSLIAGCVAEEGKVSGEVVIVCEAQEVLDRDGDGEPVCRCREGLERVGGTCAAPGEREMETPPEPELPRALPLSCWLPPGSYCDPREASGCDVGAGETCDVATMGGEVVVVCLPGPNTQGLGESCDADSGPYCAHGMRCAQGACRSICCEDGDCDAGMSCKPMSNAGSLGVCEASAPNMPTCASPGGFCQEAGDCCSGHCHAGHCH